MNPIPINIVTSGRGVIGFGIVLLFFMYLMGLKADTVEFWGLKPEALPASAEVAIDFQTHIQPIFEAACLHCHGPERPKSGFRLDNREGALEGGGYGVALIPGNSAESPLVHFVARLVEDMEMPPKEEEALTGEQVALLRAWIDQGMVWPEVDRSREFEPEFAFTSTIQFIEVQGDSRRFREHTGLDPGLSGGVQEFRFQQKLNKEEKLTLGGHFIGGQNEGSIEFLYENSRFGYVEGGFEQYRLYSDDTGGYYQDLDPPQFKLDRDLHLDFGKAWLAAGLELPDWPRIRLGYEYHFRDGEKALTQWGDMTNAAFETRNIYPAFKAVEEDLHLITLDLDHSVFGMEVQDSFSVEIYDNDTRRVLANSFTPGAATADSSQTIADDHEHWSIGNAFRAEKQLREDWLVSGGYLYSRLENEAVFSRETTSPFFTAVEPFSNQLSLDQETHVFNINTRLGPWQGLSLNAGLQSEWLNQSGLGTVVLRDFDRFPARQDSSLDRMAFVENLEIRYDRIPLTVLYAEGMFRQEELDTYESSLDTFEGFLRDTDETVDQMEYRAGFHFAPWTKFRINAYGKHRQRYNDYDHNRDEHVMDPSGPGYSAFIQERDIEENSLVVRVSGRPWDGLKTTLTYQYQTSDYTTHTGPYADPFVGVNVGPGSVLSGQYDAHIYSLGMGFNPWKRLMLSTTLSYHDTRLLSSANHSPSVDTYEGNLINLHTSTSFILDQKTDLLGTVLYSRADYEQDNRADGLPLGLNYDWLQVSLGVNRQMTENTSLRVDYVYFRYDEPWSAGLNDYEANGVFTSLMVRLP